MQLEKRQNMAKAGTARGFGRLLRLLVVLLTMAELHRAGRYDRMSDDVRRLTGRGPLSVREFVRKNAAEFTATAEAA
jgi:hypothetical protein